MVMPEQFRVLVCNEVVELKTSVHFFLLGEKDIPGLTDTTVPRRLGPKRASKIRKLFNLSKEDDVRQYVVRKPLNKDGMRDYAIQRFLNFIGCTILYACWKPTSAYYLPRICIFRKLVWKRVKMMQLELILIITSAL